MRKLCSILITAMVLSLMSGCSATADSAQVRTITQNADSGEIIVTAAESESESDIKDKISDVLSTELFTDEDATPINLDEQSGTVNITAPNNYVLTGKLEGQIVIDTASEGKVKLILNGVDIVNNGDACIYVKNADKVIVSSNEGSINNLTSKGEFIQSDENNVDAVIFSQDDLNLNGDGVINIVSEEGHGVVSKDELKIKDGEVNIISDKKGMSGKDALTIEGGVISIESRTHAIASEGDIEISGGEITISSDEKDGIHTDGNVVISDGKIDILKSSEGIEGLTVTISGGEINLKSSDDGINSSNSNSSEADNMQMDNRGGGRGMGEIGQNPFIADDGADITISGGVIYVNADGDGIDSNGTFNMTGGELYVTGPVTSADGALDYATEAIISGGKVVATGASGMAEGFGQNSTQCNILYNCNTNYEGGTTVYLYDSDGNELISYTPEKSFSSVVISSPEIKTGCIYTLVIGEDSAEIEMNSICYSTGGRGMDMMQGGGKGFGRGGGKGQGKMNENNQPPEKPDGDMGMSGDGNFDPNDTPPDGFGGGQGGPGGPMTRG